MGIRHYYKDTNQSSDKKHHIDYIEKEIGFSNFIPKFVIDTIKQKNLKKLIQTGYKKVYNYSEMEYMLKFFEMLRTQYVYDQEQFIVTLGSGWNIPVDLIIGPHVGISYITHPQANPTRVTDFENIEKITTSVLQIPNVQLAQNQHMVNSSVDSGSFGPGGINKQSEKGDTNQCTCSEIKTLLRIKVKGNLDDLAITCNGVKAAESIADLVDGYCRIVNNSNMTFWERIRLSGHNYTDSLERNGQLSMIQKELSRSAELQLHQQHQFSGKHQIPNSLYDASNIESCKFSFSMGKFHQFFYTNFGFSIAKLDNLHNMMMTNASGLESVNETEPFESKLPIMSEDYVDIGLGGEEEGKKKKLIWSNQNIACEVSIKSLRFYFRRQ